MLITAIMPIKLNSVTIEEMYNQILFITTSIGAKE